MKNRLRETYAQGVPCIGTFLQMGSPEAAECAGLAGFDFFIVDTEHSPYDLPQITACCRAAEARGITPLARISQITRGTVLKALDAGAKGLIVPGIQTVEEVRQLIEYGKYTPIGNRGFCPTRCCGWGYGGSMAQGIGAYLAQCNRDTMLIPQCETVGCLKHLEEIVALEGVDGIFIGPFDLSVALGKPGQFADEEVKQAFARVLAVCRKAGKPVYIFAPDTAAGQLRLAQGFDGICCSADLNFVADAMLNAAKTLRGAKEETK